MPHRCQVRLPPTPEIVIFLCVPLLYHSMRQIIRSLASVIAPAVAILNRIWWNFARSFGARKLRSSRVRGQNPIMPSSILPPFPPIFTNYNAFSMGRCKHCSIDARWPIVAAARSALLKMAKPRKFPQNSQNKCAVHNSFRTGIEHAYLIDNA